MAEIIEANKTENLLTHYRSVHEAGKDNITDFKRYAEGEFQFYKDNSLEEVYTADDIYGFFEGMYYRSLLIGQFQTKNDAYYAYIGIDGEMSADQIRHICQRERGRSCGKGNACSRT